MLGWAVLGFVVPASEASETTYAPLPPPETRPAPPAGSTWTPRTARLDAIQVRLGAVGAHTHANWVFFRLPFDTTERQRIRAVRFKPSASMDPNVAAVRVGNLCLPYDCFGPLETWTPYTAGGAGGSLAFWEHPNAPTSDETILGINVPTRVANYAACGWDGGRLARDDNWHLDVSWEER